MIRLHEKNINTPENSNKRFNGSVGLYDIERFEKLAKYFNGGRYLDMGAFDSILPQLLAERYPKSEIFVVDFANEILDFLRPRFPKVIYKECDIRNGNDYHLPFEDNFFDCVVAGEVIEHMEYPEKFVKELLRVIKKGGTLAISTPHKEAERGDKIGGDFHLWSYDEQDMKNLGFTEIAMQLEGRFNTMMSWQKK